MSYELRVTYVKPSGLADLIGRMLADDVELVCVVRDCESNKYIVSYKNDRDINE